MAKCLSEDIYIQCHKQKSERQNQSLVKNYTSL